MSTFGIKPQFPLEASMPPVYIGGLRRLLHRAGFPRFERFHIIELVGECMAPHITHHFAIVDLQAEIGPVTSSVGSSFTGRR